MYNLLSPAATNAKTAKNDSDNYLGAILYMAPANLSGVNLCPSSSFGCREACLFTAGRGAFDSVKKARLRRAVLFNTDKRSFIERLTADLRKLERLAKAKNKKAYCRLNGTTDLIWFFIIRQFPSIKFYDYTARIGLCKMLKAYQSKGELLNYDLTFSAKEDNASEWCAALALGFNVAMVFQSNDIDLSTLSEFNRMPVINGDQHDLRFLDAKLSGKHKTGALICLKAKGKARKDNTGFVRHI